MSVVYQQLITELQAETYLDGGFDHFFGLAVDAGETENVTEVADLIDLLWSSDEVRSRKTLVYDEINNGLHYFNVSLFQAIPQVYRNLRSALNDIYPELEKMVLPPLLRFGSWIGGDRDGNPFVTHQTTEQAVLMHADNVLRYYSKQLKHLRKRLLHCATRPLPAGKLMPIGNLV